jgi:SOS-response transcriptional repressor LexA
MNPERLQAVYVAGDSMVDEKINDGDIVIFHPGLTEGNGIFVVSIGNTLVVKRVDFDPLNQTVILISANPAYPPRQFSGHALEELRIAGRVLACVHRL